MNVEKLISTYIAAWNEDDATTRQHLIAECWAAEGAYTDPMFDVTGPEEFEQLLAGFRQQYPGHVFVITGTADMHHDLVRFTWDLVTPEGEVGVKGTDIGRIDGDGRFASIAGFFDQAPVLA
jgi:hypothetical protein